MTDADLVAHPGRTRVQDELAVRRPCVRVWWWDHCDPPGPAWWDDVDLADAGPVLACTIGYVVRETDRCVFLASTLCEDGFSRPHIILKVAIDRTEAVL